MGINACGEVLFSKPSQACSHRSLTVITNAMADLTYDLKNDVEHVEEGVDNPHDTAIPYPRTLRDMPDPPSAEALALGFELQKQDTAHGCQCSPVSRPPVVMSR